MVAQTTNHAQHEERDDMTHIQTQRLLALRVIAPPKSRLGQLIEERLAQLYNELGEEIDPAKRGSRMLAGQAQQEDRTAANTDIAGDGAAAISAANSMPQTSALELGNTSLAQSADFQDRTQTQATEVESGTAAQASETTVTSTDTGVQLQRARMRQSAATQLSQSGQINWVWMLSQLLKTDLKRLGLEPDEFDDIRVFLIKNEARKFDKLELLSRLPDSLSPEAVTKIFEDIRTMAAGYVAFVMVERAKSDLENGEELKQMPEVPRSVGGAFYGIPMIDFDPEEALKKAS
jgi:hypothetical protein